MGLGGISAALLTNLPGGRSFPRQEGGRRRGEGWDGEGGEPEAEDTTVGGAQVRVARRACLRVLSDTGGQAKGENGKSLLDLVIFETALSMW